MSGGNIVPLTSANALVTTAEVSIRMLQIGKKQVTLSVFRQIPYHGILRDDGTLAAAPWGWVNYWWDGADSWGQGQKLHVLWQFEGRLCRACVPPPEFSVHQNYCPPLGRLGELREDLKSHVDELAERRLLTDVDNGVLPGEGVWHYTRNVPVFGKIRSVVAAQYVQAVRHAYGTEDYWPKQALRSRLQLGYADPISNEDVVAEKVRMRADVRCDLSNWTYDSLDECLEGAGKIVGEAEAIMAAWRSSYEACQAAGQLFVAV